MTAAFDVAVVGAGPAGSSVAYHLAKLGFRVVLLERSSFPRDKACGDGLTRASVGLLAEMGLADELSAYRRVSGMRIVTDTKGYRDMRYPSRDPRLPQYAVVVPRLDLDSLIASNAVKAGALLWQRTVVTGPVLKNGRVCGVKVRQQESETEVAATFVMLAAGGATSAIGENTNLFKTDRWARGYAVRGYFRQVAGIDDDDLFNIHVPLLDPDGERMLAGYGWVFPLNGGNANIGVGFFPCQRQDFELNLRVVFDRFIQQLGQNDRRFRDIELIGRLRGAPLSCGMKSAHCAARGMLLAGDAAGLVDPLSGEGIGSALESGKLAAQVLKQALASANPMEADLSAYCRLLATRFDERFRTGRNLIRKYGFLGRMLENTFDIDHPLFDSVRRAVVDYGFADDQRGDVPDTDLVCLQNTNVADDVNEVRHQLAAIVQSEFPVLARVFSDLEDSTGSYLRIHLAFLAGRFGPDRARGSEAAVPIELAHLALTVHSNILDNAANGRAVSTALSSSRVRWGNMLTVMAGDYFLAKAYQLASKLGTEFSQTVSQASLDVCAAKMWHAGRAHNLDPLEDRDVAGMEKPTAAFFEVAGFLGARVTGASHDVANQLAGYGRNLGIAFALTNEILDVLADIDEPLKHPVAGLLEHGIYSWPVVSALREDDAGRLRVLLTKRPISEAQVHQTRACIENGGALVHTLELAEAFASRAKSSLENLPRIRAREILATMADSVVDRARSRLFASRQAATDQTEAADARKL